MGWKKLTFVLIPHSQEHIKQIRLSKSVIYSVISFFVIAICIMIFYILGFKGKDFLQAQTIELNEKSDILKNQLALFDTSLTDLNVRVAHLESTNAAIVRESGISEMDLQQFSSGFTYLLDSDSEQIPARVLAVINRLDRESEAFEYNFTTLFDSCIANGEMMMGVPSIRPCEGTITREFGRSSGSLPTAGLKSHPGIDITWDEGTPVVATADGVISESSFSKELGQYLIIDHKNGYRTRYAYLQTRAQMTDKLKLKKGQNVARGEKIGAIGRTGITIDATPSHVMYSVYHQGIPVNPADYFFAYDFRATSSQDVF